MVIYSKTHGESKKHTIQEHEKWHKSLGAIVGAPASSQEEEKASSETLCTLNKIPVPPSPSLPGTEPSVQEVMSRK